MLIIQSINQPTETVCSLGLSHNQSAQVSAFLRIKLSSVNISFADRYFFFALLRFSYLHFTVLNLDFRNELGSMNELVLCI